MFRLILYWLVEFLLLAGVGWLFQRAVLRRFAFDTFASMWTGLMVVVAFLQFWHLMLPVNGIPLVLMTALGGAGCFLRWAEWRRGGHSLRIPEDPDLRRRVLLAGSLALLLIFCIASRTALRNVVTGNDTNGYHLNIVRWANEFPAVPGLANLHVRLGFNTSYLLYAALLNNFWGAQRVAVLMPGFLLAVLVVKWCAMIFVERRRPMISARLFALLTVPFLIKDIWWLTPSLYYDSAPLFVGLVLAMEMLVWMAGADGEKPALRIAGSYWIGLAALAFTFKLSGASHLLWVSVFVAAMMLRGGWRSRSRWLEVLRAGAWPSLLVLGYLARNVILSGWLLFPVPVANLHLPWSPSETVVRETYERDVRNWARLPGPEAASVSSNSFWHWFGTWHRIYRHSPEKEALWIGAAAFSAWFMRRRTRDRSPSEVDAAWIARFLLISALADVLVWFVSAPDLRFGDGLIWLWMGVSVSLAAVAWFRATRFAWLVSIIVTAHLLYSLQVDIVPLKAFTWWDIGRIKPVPVRQVLVPNGQMPPLEIFMPMDAIDGVGDSPLPASLYLFPDLMMFRPGDLRHGFYRKPPAP